MLCNDINYDRLSKLVDDAKIEQGYSFWYKEFKFLIAPHHHTSKDEEEQLKPVFWRLCDDIDNTGHTFEVYIPTNLYKPEFHKPVLLHQVIEAYLFNTCKLEGENHMKLLRAHNRASEYDTLYAMQRMNPVLHVEYTDLKGKLEKIRMQTTNK